MKNEGKLLSLSFFNCVDICSSWLSFFIFHVNFRWKQTSEPCPNRPYLPPLGAPASITSPCSSKNGALLGSSCPLCQHVITTRKPGEGDQKVLISVGLRYREGPRNKWPNAQAAEETINKAIPRVITAPLFLKLTFQNFSLCKSLQRHH